MLREAQHSHRSEGSDGTTVDVGFEGVGGILDERDAEGIAPGPQLDDAVGRPVEVHRQDGGDRIPRLFRDGVGIDVSVPVGDGSHDRPQPGGQRAEEDGVVLEG